MILVINNHSHLLPELKQMLKKLEVAFILRDQKSSLHDVDERKIKGIILSGGWPDLDKKIFIDQIRADLVSLLEFEVPILGICIGHQIIGADYGGEVFSLRKASHDTDLKVQLLKRTNIFAGLPREIKVFEYHGRSVRKLPKVFELAATSQKTKIEAFFHKKKPIFGVQFHPERSGEVGERILKNFLDLC